MKSSILLTAVVALCSPSLLDQRAFAQGTAFTYQGRLNSNGNPVNGSYDFQFTLFDSSLGGTLVAGPVTNAATAVSNGLFTVMLDFGSAFPGAGRWLEMGVRSNGGGIFSTLSPRQSMTPAPYAITAGNVVSGGLAAGTYGNAVNFNNSANNLSGNFNGNGGGLTNVNAATLGGLGSGSFWNTGGNTGTSAGANFLGTADNQPLEIKVNGQRTLRLEPNTGTNGAPNVIGGSVANFAASGVIGATIGGGGSTNAFGYIGPQPNSIASSFSTIGGGQDNHIDGAWATIAGGSGNRIWTNADFSNIAGGELNYLFVGSIGSTIGGGRFNEIQGSTFAIIGGGDYHIIGTNAFGSGIGGGDGNTIYQGAAGSTISGGINHYILTDAAGSTIGGGSNNIIYPSNLCSTIGGGFENAIQGSAATVGGGQNNLASGRVATIGGGDGNAINAAAWTTISGGQTNSIGTNADYATIGGGQQNIASGIGATVSGGYEHNAVGNYSSIGGGYVNDVGGDFGTVAGGADNYAGAKAAVPGGLFNVASGDYSFAAGWQATAHHPSAFVWNDGSAGNFSSTGSNQFLIHANGGVGIGLNSPAAALQVASASGAPQLQITQQNSSDYTRLRMNVGGWPSWEMDVSPGATPSISWWNVSQRMVLDFNGNLSITGTYSPSSDRNAKENFTAVSSQEVLDKVAALPISEWNFKNDATRHIGPMAQDFYAAFKVGMDDKHIATVDADGVALAALQGLNQKVEEQLKAKDAEIEQLRQGMAELKELVKQLGRAQQPQPER